MPARTISPKSSFNASLKTAKGDTTPGKATITKTEAEHALRSLQTPKTSAEERARIVNDFLDSKGASALSPKAKDVLVDFVESSAKISTGGSLVEVKNAAHTETQQARKNLEKAHARIKKLLTTSSKTEVKAGLQQVRAWLDAAALDVLQAKAQLKRIAKNIDAKGANKDLTAARKDFRKAANEVAELIAQARTGKVTKADLEAVRTWLAASLPDLDQASQKLEMRAMTKKFPSDSEDSGGDGMYVTMKAPSDNEDGGSGGAVTEKYPSDAEDGGGGDVREPDGRGTVYATMKYPSDNEDGGTRPVGSIGTERYPSDNEDGGVDG